MNNFGTALLLAAVAFATPEATSVMISGPAIVIDGDTLLVNRVHIRLFGIDAPEIEQRCQDAQNRAYNCGLLAADVLTEEIGNAIVTCFPIEKDRYARTVAVCLARDLDLAERMVSRGHAVDYPFFSGGKYREAEREAIAARRGIWAGSFTHPSIWRQEHRR